MSPSRAPRVAIFIACSGLACATPPTSDQGRAPRTSSTSSQPSHTELDSPSEPGLGWASLPERPSARVEADNHHAKSQLEAGAFADALATLDAALARDPDYGWARYNRACALAHLRREEEAHAELFALMREDLPRFGPYVLADDQLAELRASPFGPRLEGFRLELNLAYAAALERGVTAWFYHPRSALSPRTNTPQAPYEDLRLGVFDPASARFVPLSPEHPLALGGLLERELGRLMMISGEVYEADMHVVQAKNIGVHVYALDALGVGWINERRLDARRPATENLRRAVAAALEPEAVRLSYYDLGYTPNTLSALVGPDTHRVLGLTRHDLPVDEQTGLEHHIRADQRYLHIDGHGVTQHQPHPQATIAAGRLVLSEPEADFRLSPRHTLEGARTRIQRSPDGRYLMVFDQLARCHEDGAERVHALSRVDLDTRELTLLASGEGLAGAELGPEGWVYYSIGEDTMRFAPGSSEAQRDLPLGVHFALPAFAYDCGV